MCGVFSLAHTAKEVGAYFDYPSDVQFPPRDFITPGQPIAIVRNEEKLAAPERELALVRWGFVPGWAKEVRPGRPLINARAETIVEKPSFRHAIRRRRCLVPASGFYEWKGDMPGKKQPFFVPKSDGGLVALAGIWEHWMGEDGSELETAAIITTAANATLAPIHHRMPVVIAKSDFASWLDAGSTPLETAVGMLKPAPEDYFAPRETELKRPARPKPDDNKPTDNKTDQLKLF